jgi:hypothetical protein
VRPPILPRLSTDGPTFRAHHAWPDRRPGPTPCPDRVGRSMVKTTTTQTVQEPVCSFRERSRQERKASLRRRLTGEPDVHASAGSLILSAGDRRCSGRRRPCTTLSIACVIPCCSCLPITCPCGSATRSRGRRYSGTVNSRVGTRDPSPGVPDGGPFPNTGRALRRTATGELVPYYDRGQIEDGALDGQHLESLCRLRSPPALPNRRRVWLRRRSGDADPESTSRRRWQ